MIYLKAAMASPTPRANAQGYSQTNSALISVAGVLLGGLFLQLAHQFMLHEHFFKGRESCQGNNLFRYCLGVKKF
jgi:zinc transporter, ZIP family